MPEPIYTLFVDVILPVPLAQAYTYAVPDEYREQIEIGKRVIVQFGKQKLYSALIWSVHNNPPLHHKPKPLLDVVDENVIVSKQTLELWQWIAGYYMCTPGEVMAAALPSGLRLQSETIVRVRE